MFQLTPIVKKILIINAVILFLEYILKISFSPLLGVHYLFSEDFYIFQYVTYMWLHADFWHFIRNMLPIVFLGSILENSWGAKRFLIFYLITGIGAGILYGAVGVFGHQDMANDKNAFLANPNPEAFDIFIHNHAVDNYDMVTLGDFANDYYDQEDNTRITEQAKSYVSQIYNQMSNSNMIGASGAVFGVLLAFAMLFPGMEIRLLFPPIPIKAAYLVYVFAAYEIYSEINKADGDNISHFTHISGMIVAFIVLKYWQKKRGDFY